MRKDILKKLFIVPAIILFSAGCSKNQDENLPTEPVKINLTSTQTSIVGSGNDFAFDIFKRVEKSAENGQNIMISPLSISYALSMVMNGANGATRDSILKALRFQGLTPDEVNGSFKTLTEALLSVDKRVAMSIANSVWIENNFVVKQPFRDILANYYSAESKYFDITDPDVVVPINNWISDKTNGLITNMLQSLPDNEVMLLINAIYFKGKWQTEFKKEETTDATFNKPSGSSAIKMMNQTDTFKVYDGDGFKLGEFPYGQGNFVMDIILPDATDGLLTRLSLLTKETFNSWVGQMEAQKVELSLPRFKYGFESDLTANLSKMGMGIAFSDAADLTNIADMGLLITGVFHKTFIETNEEGTEAAAVTIVGVGTTSVGPDPIIFKADHPFIYIIRETTTNSIIFMGKVEDPSVN